MSELPKPSDSFPRRIRRMERNVDAFTGLLLKVIRHCCQIVDTSWPLIWRIALLCLAISLLLKGQPLTVLEQVRR